jgi:chromosome segregation ATPase
MTGVESEVVLLRTRLRSAQDRVKEQQELIAHLERKLDRQKSELGRLARVIAELGWERASLQANLRWAMGER